MHNLLAQSQHPWSFLQIYFKGFSEFYLMPCIKKWVKVTEIRVLLKVKHFGPPVG